MPIEGAVRLNRDVREVVRNLAVGEIAVIDLPDLDRESAELLASRRPAAVLNVADSASGRMENLGPKVLLDAGILHLDRFGTEILALRDGQRITVTVHHHDDQREPVTGSVSSAEGAVIAEGELVGEQRTAAAVRATRAARSFQLDGLAATTAELLAAESDLIFDGAGLPTGTAPFHGRPVLVVGDRANTPAQLGWIRPWIRESRPYIIAVEGGADHLRAANLRADVVLGPLEDVSDAAIARPNGRKPGPVLLLHAKPDMPARGSLRVEELGREHGVLESRLPSWALALLMAERGGASVVVASGIPETGPEVLDSGRTPAAAAVLTRLGLGGLLVYASALPALVRPRIRTWQLLLLSVVALGALAIALLTTPVGQAAFNIGPDWLANLFNG